MSSVVVVTKRIDQVRAHPNADRLEIVIVGGWQTVVPKGLYSVGSQVTYVPPDCVVPPALAERWGIAKYLSNGRVRATKLRGEASYGFVVPAEGKPGENLAAALGITKWQPPAKFGVGDAEPEHPLFTRYTDVENMRHFPSTFAQGELVQIAEKVHGVNVRIALIDGQRYAGSRTMQRKHAEDSIYWHAWAIPAVVQAMERLNACATHAAVLYGEVYGRVQTLTYGRPDDIAFVAFDASIDGKYLDAQDLRSALDNVPLVPLIEGAIPLNLDNVAACSRGPSMMPGARHIREGVVVRPLRERWDPAIGRVILKYVSDDYLTGDYDAASE